MPFYRFRLKNLTIDVCVVWQAKTAILAICNSDNSSVLDAVSSLCLLPDDIACWSQQQPGTYTSASCLLEVETMLYNQDHWFYTLEERDFNVYVQCFLLCSLSRGLCEQRWIITTLTRSSTSLTVCVLCTIFLATVDNT
jgi:hypothetical protein